MQANDHSWPSSQISVVWGWLLILSPVIVWGIVAWGIYGSPVSPACSPERLKKSLRKPRSLR